MAETNPNFRYVLWSGTGILQYGNEAATMDCCAYQEATGNGEPHIECADAYCKLHPFSFIASRDLRLELPCLTEHLDVIPSESSKNASGEFSLSLRPLKSPYWFSRSQALKSGRFVLVNFAPYWMGHPGNLNFTLEANGWSSQFIAVNDKSLELPLSKDNDEYRFTHQVEFSRSDATSFSEEEAKNYLWKLSLFLSFCRGHWVGHSLAVGLNENGEAVLWQWGSGRVSAWQGPDGWLDEYHGNCITILFNEFSKKLEQPDWLAAIQHVVYWFARADTNNVGPDGSCILLQAALERLAWHILVRERKAISSTGFKQLHAADQLRQMLDILSIPTTIPAGLVKLQILGQTKGLDGPGVFTHIRNRLTHPPKASAPTSQLPYYEAYCLAQWYVELAILSACGYTGQYGNRTIMRRWKGQVEKVPWAS